MLHEYYNEREVTLVAREPLKHVVLYTMSCKRKHVGTLQLIHVLYCISRLRVDVADKKEKGTFGMRFTKMLKRMIKRWKVEKSTVTD